MVDSKEIEELRALAFASIPTVARKAQFWSGNSILGGKRKRTPFDTEEGEIVSDEDAAAAAAFAMPTSLPTSVPKSHVDGSSSGSFREVVFDPSTRQKKTVSGACEAVASFCTETPSIVTVVPSFTHVAGLKENWDFDLQRPSMVETAKEENAASPKPESSAKREEIKFSQQSAKLLRAPQTSKPVAGSLTSKIPTAPLPAVGIRKEADAFLASLNIPATASPSHLSSFVGERNNSLVIKFSDNDSDSDVEQDEQVMAGRSITKTGVANEPLASSNLGARMGLSSQSTSGLKSEIDRVKKQIAAIERAKGIGASLVSRLSKSTTTEQPRPSNMKVSVNSRSVPVDLESLRQQIAAKESELKRRKQKGLNEFLNIGNVPASSWAIDAIELTQTSDARVLSLERSETDVGGAEVFIEDPPTMSVLQVNEALSSMNGESLKKDHEPERAHSPPVPDFATASGNLSLATTSQISTVGLETPLLGMLNESPSVEALPLENTMPALESHDQLLTSTGKVDMSSNKTKSTPKRKRHELDQAGTFSFPLLRDSAKKPKRKRSSVFAQSLMHNSSNEARLNPAFSLDGSLVPNSKVAAVEKDTSRSFEEMTLSAQGLLKDFSTSTEPQPDKCLRTVRGCLFLNTSDHTDVPFPLCVEKAMPVSLCNATKHIGENSVSEAAVLSQLNTAEVPHGVKDVAKATVQQEDRDHAEDTLKDSGASTDMAGSPRSSPSRAVIEHLGCPSVLSRDEQMPQGIFVEASSACASVPVWAYNGDFLNLNMAALQEVGNERLEPANDALRKLQEEEDAIDKELEEAQQSRRRCEVREHFARRQYRDAQEALHSANVRCEMLFHKREMLSASAKAAQLRVYSNKSSFVSEGCEGALVPLGSLDDRFTIRASFWAQREEVGKPPTNCLSDQHHNGLDSDFTSASQLKQLSCLLLDGSLASEKALGVDVRGLDEPVAFDDTANKPRADHSDNVGVLVRTASFSALPKDSNTVLPLSEEPLSQCLSAQVSSVGPVVRGIILDSFTMASPGDEDRLPITTVAEDMHGKNVEKGSHHGFSSASFATDLDSDANLDNLITKKSSKTREKSTGRQNSFYFQPLSLPTSKCKEAELNQSSKDSLCRTVRVSPTVENDTGICVSKNLANRSLSGQFIDLELEASSALLCEKAPQSPGQQEWLDGRNQIIKQAVSSSSDTCLNRQRPIDDSLKKLASVEATTMDWDKVSETFQGTSFDKETVVKDSCVLQLGRSPVVLGHHYSGLPSSELHRKTEDSKQPMSAFEAEVEAAAMVHKVPVESDIGFRLEKNSSSLTDYVPSASLNVLLRHAVHPHMFEIWKEQIVSGVSDESNHCVPGKYESPLSGFRFYRGKQQPVYAINPHRMLCMYEHRGKCNNDECIWQHKRDYMMGSSPLLKQGIDGSEPQDALAEKERNSLISIRERADISVAASQKFRNCNVQALKVPVYRIGSYLRRTQCSESFLSSMIKGQFGAGQPFLALHRQAPMEMPCLFDSSLKLQTLNDNSVGSRQVRVEDRLWIEDEGRHSGTLEDAESLLEAALELFDYDLKVQKSEVRKSVLYVLSRGLEANPYSVPLWVVYLHLFYRWEKSLSKEDLFVNAVLHNKGSYELWMMYINSRRHLMDRLKVYESAIVALGSLVELQGHPSESKSPFLLDLALQKLNYMCISDLRQEAVSWIDNLTAATMEEESLGSRHEASCLVLLTSLALPDLCILWICCAYVVLQNQLPMCVIECLGCKQHLFFQDIWVDSKKRSPCDNEVMRVMHVGASQGKGCMRLDVNETVDKSCQFAKDVFAASLVQCSAVCEGVDGSLVVAEKYFRLLTPSVELTLLRAQLQECQMGKAASLEIFEEALTRWPLHQSGKMRLWNQYIGCAYEAKGPNFVKVLLSRCAREISDADSGKSVSKHLGSVTSPVLINTLKPTRLGQWQDSLAAEEVCKASVRSAFQLLPLIVKRQLTKGSVCSGQVFSYQDAMFGFVNLAFLEVLEEDGNSARNALQSSLNIATDADTMRHCLKEITVFTCGGLDSSTLLPPSTCSHKLLDLIDRCIVETQLLGVVHSLSRGFIESINKRRVCQFVASLLGPSPTDSTFLNCVLESIHGPTLLPKETLAWRDFLDCAEKILEILPSNVRLASALCRVVQSKIADDTSSTGPAALFWCNSLLIDSLCQASPEAPEPLWVEAGGFVKMLGIDYLLEEFYQLAISVYPFSTSLWHGLLTVGSRTGNFKSALELARGKGVKLGPQFSGL